MAAELGAVPPRDAIQALRTRGLTLAPSFAWQDVYADDHAAMFTVAKSAGYDILEDIWQALLLALSEGRTYRDFAAELTPLLQRKGWWGRTLATDPLDGVEKLVQLGSPRRLELIFKANMRVSYAVGHWANFERNKSTRPFLRYVAIMDEATRPHHADLHNLVLPVDHPFWNTFAPPNGWNCRCTLQSLSQADIDALLAEGVPLTFAPPEINWRDWTNKRTGEVRRVPDGVDPGWDHNPGKAGFAVAIRDAETKPRTFL